jgi:hypothetical protein
MTRRLDAMVARKNGEKTYWTRIGVAFEGERGWRVVLDALPLPDDRGQTVIHLFEPRPREDKRSTDVDLDDDVPF